MENAKELSPIALGKAAGEVMEFVGQFRALTVVAAALEEAGGLERRLGTLRQELADFPVKRQAIEDGIVKASEGTLASLRSQVAGLTVKRDALLAETEAARRELDDVKTLLEDRQTTLNETEARIADFKARLG
ncbi:MAG: hypothetical protein ACYC37_03475 [Desulfobacteria bacterium]